MELALEHPKVEAWLDRYPADPTTDADFRSESRTWLVKVWSGEAGQVAQAVVEDTSGRVAEAWTGPQVAWKMARGREGAFGGKTLLRPYVWLGFCLIFIVGLADLRRPFSARNLDLLALLGFTASLAFFERGELFRSVPLVYPMLAYLLARGVWVGIGRRGDALSPPWPTWVLAAAAVFMLGFRVGLNLETPRGVIDVGLAGVVGGSRILDGEAPYGNMPQRGDLEPCGPEDADGQIRERIQTNGRCEAAIERGDTYGPVSYLAYVPAVALFPWSGAWDSLPAAHATSIAFDLLAVLALVLMGLRFGGRRLAVLLAFGWAAYPFTAYTLNANTNDAIMPVFLLFGFLLVTSDWARGGLVALAGWTKFGALLVAPLWATYPVAELRRIARFAAAFTVATVLAFSILLLEPSLWEAIRTFWERSIAFQSGRNSPFSIWGWGQYHARGIPDLGFLQPAAAVLAVALAGVVAVVPRRKTPLQLAALTAALLVAFQLTLTHWFYLYLPWVVPFVFLWLLIPEPDDQETGTRIASIEEALPVAASQSTTAPSIRTPP
ncbi:MAG: glycosyltransferase 87 family protein [Gaiellaceae bacterium]